ncbi:hypothetical protein BH23VER1_BH23VER1_25080 [soil metagenome]
MSRTGKAGVLAISQGVSTLIGLAILASLSRILDKHNYATYQQTLLVYRIVAPLLLLGLPQAILYFASSPDANQRKMVLENIVALLGTGFLFCGFLVAGGNRFIAERFNNPDLEHALLLLALYALVMPAVTALPTCLLAFGEVRRIALFNLVVRTATFVAVVAAAYSTGGAQMAVAALVVVNLVAFFPAVALMVRAPSSGTWKVTTSGIREQLHYSVPLGLSTILAALTMNLDKVIVSVSFPAEEFAVYANGAIEIPFISVITGAASAVLIAGMAPLFRIGEAGEAMAMWRRSALKVAGILYPAFVGLMIFAPEIITLLFSIDYVDSAQPFRVYLLLLPFRVAFFGTIFQAIGANRTIFVYSGLSLVLNTAVSLALVQVLGPVGAAVGTVVVTIGFTIPFCIVAIRRRIGSEAAEGVLPWRGLSNILLAAAACGAVALGIKLLATELFGSLWGNGLAIAIYGVSVVLVFEHLRFLSTHDLFSKVWSAHK